MWKSSLLILGLTLPLAISANGGMQKVAEGKYIVNISSAPIAPFVGEKQALLIAFADIGGNLLEQDISVDLTLKFQREPILAKKNLTAENGILPFEYSYKKPGLYELFVAFRLPGEPDHTYMPEDFLIEVKERDSPQQPFPMLAVVGTGLIGLLLGFALGKRFSFLPFFV